MLAQSRRALEYLHPHSQLSCASAYWTLGYAFLFQGDRVAARRALGEAIAIGQTAGDTFTTILATIPLGNVEEADNQLYQAAEIYRNVLELAGNEPLQIITEARLGLARVLYEWSDLEAAESHGQQGLKLARQYESVIDRYVSCEVFLARLKLAQGDVVGATTMLARADRSVREQGFVHRAQEVAAARVRAFLHRGDLEAAAHLAASHELPISQARVHIARKEASAALAVLGPVREKAEGKGWADQVLKVTILEAVAYYMLGQNDEAVSLLEDALAMAESGGFVRTFVDEGPPMVRLLSEAAARGIVPDYIARLLAAFEDMTKDGGRRAENEIPSSVVRPSSTLVEPLSEREIEVLQLIAEGLTNQKVADRLYLSLHTVKVHARNIYGKLGVKNRTQAVAKARALGILVEP
jgi:LuxR family maltose regulon positive regulatory protein